MVLSIASGMRRILPSAVVRAGLRGRFKRVRVWGCRGCRHRRVTVYQVDKLMNETRRLASEYRRATGQVLPVSAELARYDATRLLSLQPVDPPRAGVDALDADGRGCQIKSRVLFRDSRSRERIGQLNLEADWARLLLVLLDEQYETQEILCMSRSAVEDAIAGGEPGRQRRGAMSVAKFRVLAERVWPPVGDSPL